MGQEAVRRRWGLWADSLAWAAGQTGSGAVALRPPERAGSSVPANPTDWLTVSSLFQETFDAGLQAFQQEGIANITALKDQLLAAKHIQSKAIEARHASLMKRWSQLLANSATRKKKLLEAQGHFRKVSGGVPAEPSRPGAQGKPAGRTDVLHAAWGRLEPSRRGPLPLRLPLIRVQRGEEVGGLWRSGGTGSTRTAQKHTCLSQPPAPAWRVQPRGRAELGCSAPRWKTSS